MMRGEHISIEDLALFSLGNLPSEEMAELRRHLEECEPCRSQWAELSGDLARVAAAVDPVPLPVGARDRFLAKIGKEPAREAKGSPILVPVRTESPSKPLLWVLSGALAALLVLAVSLLIRIHSLDEQLRDQSSTIARLTSAASHAQEVFDVITAPNAQRIVLSPAKTSPAPTARAIYLPSRGDLVFEAADLAPLPPGKAYELWVIPASGAAPIPAGTFWPDARGSASLVLPPLPKDVPAKAFGVTIEKAEGSSTPTAPIILAGAA